jgi:hypothetical protein
MAGAGAGLALGVRSLESYWVTTGLLWLGWGVSSYAVARALSRHLQSRPRLRSALQNVSLSFYTLAFLLLILELAFRLFVARSDTLSNLLASRNWSERYFRPINSLGYRDAEWTPAALAGRTRVVVLGDSFAAGYGIRDIEDRFSGVLGRELGEDFAVMTVADGGWDTGHEAAALAGYPYAPDIVVLSYYVNDISEAAGLHGVTWPEEMNVAYRAPQIVWESYLLNFLYFQAVRLPRSNVEGLYMDFLRGLYEDPAIWATHAAQLSEIEAWSDEHDARLLVLIFPGLVDPVGTDFATRRVASLFREHGVPVLEVRDLIEGWETRDLIVHRYDAHPSQALSEVVGVALADAVRRLAVDGR